jgi:hypothetical protein
VPVEAVNTLGGWRRVSDLEDEVSEVVVQGILCARTYPFLLLTRSLGGGLSDFQEPQVKFALHIAVVVIVSTAVLHTESRVYGLAELGFRIGPLEARCFEETGPSGQFILAWNNTMSEASRLRGSVERVGYQTGPLSAGH